MCVCVCVCVCEKAVVFLFENSETHLDKTTCSSLKLPLKQGALHITRGFPSRSTECSINNVNKGNFRSLKDCDNKYVIMMTMTYYSLKDADRIKIILPLTCSNIGANLNIHKL